MGVGWLYMPHLLEGGDETILFLYFIYHGIVTFIHPLIIHFVPFQGWPTIFFFMIFVLHTYMVFFTSERVRDFIGDEGSYLFCHYGIAIFHGMVSYVLTFNVRSYSVDRHRTFLRHQATQWNLRRTRFACRNGVIKYFVMMVLARRVQCNYCIVHHNKSVNASDYLKLHRFACKDPTAVQKIKRCCCNDC